MARAFLGLFELIAFTVRKLQFMRLLASAVNPGPIVIFYPITNENPLPVSSDHNPITNTIVFRRDVPHKTNNFLKK